jgi:Co/Zn/Cd efflux system component
MNDTCCHGLDVAALEGRQRQVLIRVLTINVLTFAMMVLGSVLSGSSSLLSGTLDNLGDALTYAASLAVVGPGCAAKARVALIKSVLILGAAFAVGVQILWRVPNFEAPIFETMGIAALLNLGANGLCLWLLHPYRDSDMNMSSVWECSRNDVFEGFAVIGATISVWLFDSGWPDVLIAAVLLAWFLRSATRIFRNAWRTLYPAPSSS